MKIEVETMIGSYFEEYSSVHVCNFEFTNHIIVAHYPCYQESINSKDTYSCSIGRWKLKKLK